MWECVGWIAELNKHERSVIHGHATEEQLVSAAHSFLPANEEARLLVLDQRQLKFTHTPPHIHTHTPRASIVLSRDSTPFVLFSIFCSELEITRTGGTTRRCEREFVCVEGMSYPVFVFRARVSDPE